MSTLTARRGLLTLAVASALLVGSFAVVASASASTLYACVKKSGSAHVFAKKPKCKKGEQKLSWNTPGPAGKNGANGTNGTNGTNGKDGIEGAAGQPQKAAFFNSTLEAAFEPPKVATLFSLSGVTVKLTCFFFLGNFSKIEASGPVGSRAETGMVVTNEKSESPEVPQEPIKDVAVGTSATTIVQLSENTKSPFKNIAHVNGSILTTSAVVVFDGFLSTGANPEGCVARGTAYSIPL
jgi:hypothetical protein